MFFPESERIVEQHSDVAQVVQSLDQLLFSFPQGGLVQPDYVATAIGISHDQLTGILDLYMHAGLLQRSEMIRCPNCSTLMKEGDSQLTNHENHITCSSCEKAFEPRKRDFVYVYLMLKPGRSRSLGYVDQPKVVFALHGINTYADWHRMFGEVVEAGGWKCRTDRWYYGKFSVLRFLRPRQRSERVAWFRKEYDEECNDIEVGVNCGNDQFPSIVAHSFGTYVLGNALLKYDNIKFNKVILCGSILPADFPWDKILERGQVQYVLNEFGSDDKWSKRVRFAVRGSGPSGVVGFSVKHDRLSQFEYQYEHSEYFDKGHIRSKWLSFLDKDEKFWPSKRENIATPSWPMPWLGRVVFGAMLLSVVCVILFGQGISRFASNLVHHSGEPLIDEPTSAINLVNVLAEPDFPTKTEVLKNLAKPPQETTLTIQNSLARPLKLLLFNCFAHYNPSTKDPNLHPVPFIELPLPPATESGPSLQPFSKFPPKFSYYGLYIIDGKNGAMTKVGFVDLSSKRDWFLRISDSDDAILPEWTDAL